MLPEIDLGPVTLQTFGICLALAFLASGAVGARRLEELGKPLDWAYEMLFAALVGGLVGSRIHYVIENYDRVSDDLIGGLFTGSGLVFFGGLIGGAVAVLLWAWRRDFLEWRMVDLGAVPVAIGYAVGRVGCQLSGDGDYGDATDLPWGMAYPEGTVATTQEVQPTPVFETVAMGLVALLLWRLRERVRPGGLFALYLVLAGLERFAIEFIRRNEVVLAGLTQPQLISIAMVAGGAALLARSARGPVTPRPA